jgi:hypothetical protein
MGQPSTPNFVIKPSVTPEQAIELLVQRFPIVLSLVDSRDELTQMGPYYTYGVLAGEVKPRIADREFLKSMGTFVNELAKSTDPLLRNLLLTVILERIADDPYTAATFRYYIEPEVQGMLGEVEQAWFGKTSGGTKP